MNTTQIFSDIQNVVDACPQAHFNSRPENVVDQLSARRSLFSHPQTIDPSAQLQWHKQLISQLSERLEDCYLNNKPMVSFHSSTGHNTCKSLCDANTLAPLKVPHYSSLVQLCLQAQMQGRPVQVHFGGQTYEVEIDIKNLEFESGGNYEQSPVRHMRGQLFIKKDQTQETKTIFFLELAPAFDGYAVSSSDLIKCFDQLVKLRQENSMHNENAFLGQFSSAKGICRSVSLLIVDQFMEALETDKTVSDCEVSNTVDQLIHKIRIQTANHGIIPHRSQVQSIQHACSVLLKRHLDAKEKQKQTAASCVQTEVANQAQDKTLNNQIKNNGLVFVAHSERDVMPCLKTWSQTIQDIKAVRRLRKKLSFEGYPFSRLVKNQIGDGILNSSIAGLAVVAASADPLSAGILVWGTRTVEYAISVIWNQRMSSERRLARLAAEGTDVENKLSSKLSAARELVSSCKYDFISGAATIAGLATALFGGPVGLIIALGTVIAITQTLSRFKEMSWGALRYLVNPNDDLQKEIVNLQEPMGAYEMAINIGSMTLAYIVGFAAITVFYVFLPHVALPVSIAMGLFGLGMMLKAKSQFRKEEKEAKHALDMEKIWQASFRDLQQNYESYLATDGNADNLEKTRFEGLRKACDILKQNLNGHSEDELLRLKNELDDYTKRLEQHAIDPLESFLAMDSKDNSLSLTDWPLQELASLYRVSESAKTVTLDALGQWLAEQCRINQQVMGA